MPKGVPKAGFRISKKAAAIASSLPLIEKPKVETEAEIEKRISERFEALNVMSKVTAQGINRSLIISGPPGLGKSYTILKVLDRLAIENSLNYKVVRGYVKSTGIYKILHDCRYPNSVVVFDDADSVFGDDVSLNLLKAACDSLPGPRKLSWLTETRMLSEDGADFVPRSFDYEGSIIFITNYSFDKMSEGGHKLAPHFQALISRSHYLDLGFKSTRDYVVRIKQACREGLLDGTGLIEPEKQSIIEFIETNLGTIREVSLRMVLKLAGLVKMDRNNWQALARCTCLKE